MDTAPTPLSDDLIAGAPIKPGDKDERLGGPQSQQPIFDDAIPAQVAPPVQQPNTFQGNFDQVTGSTLNQPAPQAATPLQFSSKPLDEPVYADGKRPDGSDLDKGERLLTAIGYIGILALLPLLLRRDSAYCRHHGSQGLVLAAIITITELVFRLLGVFLIGTNALIIVLILITWIICFTLAFSGSWFRLPGIYGWSRQLELFSREVGKEDRLHNQD